MIRPGDVRRGVLTDLYGASAAEIDAAVTDRIARVRRARPAVGLDEQTAWLSAYPSHVYVEDEPTLQTLRRAVADHLQPEITGVHLLPFHPSSSDGGFSVTSFAEIDPVHGDWDDLRALTAATSVMADAVVNHASAKGAWFRAFLADDSAFAGFFREVPADADLAAVVRPRTSPIPTTFRRDDGSDVTVWATFSADQIDLDYRNPRVLLAVTDVILSYVEAGADAVRLDAVAFLWKEEGSTSIHLPETHSIIRFIRACIDEIDPGVMLVTETNVPHEENVSYFGSPPGREAQAVYQFPLPPLVLHAFASGSATELRAWARSLTFDRDDTSFLNFLASHDGIGLRPVAGLLSAEQQRRLEALCLTSGGAVNVRRMPDGSDSPYELTGTWFSFMAAGHSASDGLDRHVSSHAIAFALRGVPIVYAQSIAACGNDLERFAQTGQGRDLNRATFHVDEVRSALADPATRASRCWTRLRAMLRWRASSPAFAPRSEQIVLDGPDEVFAVRRVAIGGEEALVVVNVSHRTVRFAPPGAGWSSMADGRGVDGALDLAPWANVWLRRMRG